MTADTSSPDRLKWVASDLMLGFLVTALSVFTALANYATYQVGGSASDNEAQADRLLADSNAQAIRATQYVVVDYSMYDGYYINLDVDDSNADYYQSQFSEELQASIDRNSPFDDQYYDAMYSEADDMLNEAFAKFDEADAEYQRVAGFQLAMLISAVGLAFAAYSSLLQKENRLRSVFALMSLSMLVWSVGQFSFA